MAEYSSSATPSPSTTPLRPPARSRTRRGHRRRRRSLPRPRRPDRRGARSELAERDLVVGPCTNFDGGGFAGLLGCVMTIANDTGAAAVIWITCTESTIMAFDAQWSVDCRVNDNPRPVTASSIGLSRVAKGHGSPGQAACRDSRSTAHHDPSAEPGGRFSRHSRAIAAPSVGREWRGRPAAPRPCAWSAS